jgi:hypothetical protein
MSDIGKLPFLPNPTSHLAGAKRSVPSADTPLAQDTLSSTEPLMPESQLRLHASKTFTGARNGQAASEANVRLGQGWNDFLTSPSKAAAARPEEGILAAYDSQRDGLIGK